MYACIVKINWCIFHFDITSKHHFQSSRLKDTIRYADHISVQIQLYDKYSKYISELSNNEVRCHGQNVVLRILIYSYLDTQGGNECIYTPVWAIRSRALSILQVTGAEHFWKKKSTLQVCPRGTTMQCDAAIPKVAVSELSLCTRNSTTMFIMLGLIIGLKSLFEGKT